MNIYIETTDSRDSSAAVYATGSKPYKLPGLAKHQLSVKGDLPRIGISIIEVSHNNTFIATKNENNPNCVWIWDLNTLALNTILIQKHEVTAIQWCPKMLTLNISAGDGKLYIWTLKGASICNVPVNKENFTVNSIEWNPNGKSFAALDKGGLVFVYPSINFYDEQD